MVFFVFTILAILLVAAFLKDRKTVSIVKQPCRKGHVWEEVPVDEDEEYFYLKCQNCNKTLSEVLSD